VRCDCTNPCLLLLLLPPLFFSVPRSDACIECRGTEFIEDWKQGDSICRGCGLVRERLVDPGEEKRHFADSDENPHRTSAENSYVDSLGTAMSAVPGTRNSLTRIADHTISSNDRNVIAGIDQIARLCTFLKLAPRIAVCVKCQSVSQSVGGVNEVCMLLARVHS
jgi:transcription initiation factor TFIIIB Brf1 subunit/transcription initiation factor TFIIB